MTHKTIKAIVKKLPVFDLNWPDDFKEKWFSWVETIRKALK